ncbi:hypothetical protein Bca4012_026395 [Brassica carinata]
MRVMVPGSFPIEIKDILKSSAKGNECSLNYGPHPIDIESGPLSKDRVRCRTGLATKKNQEELRVPMRCTSIPQGNTTKNQPPRPNEGSRSSNGSFEINRSHHPPSLEMLTG